MLLILMLSSAFAHGGRTDSSGGHNDNVNGGYHYHSGGIQEYDDDIDHSPILDCISTKNLSKIGESFECDGYLFTVIARYGYPYDNVVQAIRPLNDLHANRCQTSYIKIDGVSNPIICNGGILSVKLTPSAQRAEEERKKDLLDKEEIKSIQQGIEKEKSLSTERLSKLKAENEKYLASIELFRKEQSELESKSLLLKEESVKLKQEKIEFESQKKDLEKSKKALYREEADDVCGKVALKIYKKFKKNPKKYSNDLASFSKKEGFNKKCESLDYSKLILPVLSDQKCGKFALQIQASYNSNKKYYGDLSVAEKHYSFNLYCPGIQYINFIEEINDSSNKE